VHHFGGSELVEQQALLGEAGKVLQIVTDLDDEATPGAGFGSTTVGN